MSGVSIGRVRALAQSSDDAHVGREIEIAADLCFAPIRISVSGRTGVGKTAVRAALSSRSDFATAVQEMNIELVEAASIDVPRSPDPVLDGDVVVHVVAGGVQQADTDAVASARLGAGDGGAGEGGAGDFGFGDTTSPVVVVLAKADTIENPGDIAERMSKSLGTPVLPLMSTIAASVASGRPRTFDALRPVAHTVTDDMLLTPDRFLAADIAVSQGDRAELVEQIESFGIGVVAAALTENRVADDAILRSLLTRRSGIEDVVRAVRRAVDGVRVGREGRLLHRLSELAAHDPVGNADIERYLASDESVVAIMRAGLRALGESEVDAPTSSTVHQWFDRFRSTREPSHARAALAVARGYTRIAMR